MTWVLKGPLQRLTRNGQFTFQKKIFSEGYISKKKADFDSRLQPMENMDLLLAAYT
jgi:hypothetical protein